MMSIICDVMKKTVLVPVSSRNVLSVLGEQLKLARLRRNLRAEVVAERAGVSRSTLWQVEKGTPSVTLGAYFMILFALGLERDLLLVAKDDELGRKLQDAHLVERRRAKRRKPSA